MSEADKTYFQYKTMFVSSLGIDGRTRYGSYKQVHRKTLEGREFVIEFLDYSIAIFLTDVIYDPRNHVYINKKDICLLPSRTMN